MLSKNHAKSKSGYPLATAKKSPKKGGMATIWDTIFGLGGEKRGKWYKYEHYLFIISAFVILLSALALLNGYFRYVNFSPSYDAQASGFSAFVVAGYLGMFFSIAFAPVPDYILVPIYGYISSIGIFNPITTFLVCTGAAIFLMGIEYAGGRLMGRPLLLKFLARFHITEGEIEAADSWLVKHGKFSIFISTFIPYFYSVTSLAAGTLKMRPIGFFAACVAGFGIRFAFFDYLGYSSIYVFTASFDYSQRWIFFFVLFVSSFYFALYLLRNSRHPGIVQSVGK